MNYGLTAIPTLDNGECVILGVFADQKFPAFVKEVDPMNDGLLGRLFQKMRTAGDFVWQAEFGRGSLLMVHCGNEAAYSSDFLSKRIVEITALLIKNHISRATICMPQLAQHSADWQIQHMLLLIEAQRYQLVDFKTKKQLPPLLESILFYLPEANNDCITTTQAIAEGINFTRTLANFPANICTPTYLSEQALQLAQQHRELTVKILNRDDMQQLGMGALLAVAQGSTEPPKLIEIQYSGGGDERPIVLVGKGITFDTGGLSLKPADAMTEMKYDMAGAASVLGTIKACALLKLPINVVGLVASAENMVSGCSMKPGDIVTSMSGQTIEIINTDAEGRLVLADALTYAERFNPLFVIDIATLTGAMIVALGTVNTGFMTKDDDLADLLMTAARASEDKVWRLPLDEAYQSALDSPIADMINGAFDRTAGSITAACFLSRYTHKYRWAHLDIAGTAWISGKNRNATGRPVPLLIQLLRHVANSR